MFSLMCGNLKLDLIDLEKGQLVFSLGGRNKFCLFIALEECCGWSFL